MDGRIVLNCIRTSKLSSGDILHSRTFQRQRSVLPPKLKIFHCLHRNLDIFDIAGLPSLQHDLSSPNPTSQPAIATFRAPSQTALDKSISTHTTYDKMPMTIAKKYEIGDLIGRGTYASIFQAKDLSGNQYAVKCETSSAPKPVIHEEARIYRRINYCTFSKYQNCHPRGIPRAYHFEILKDRGARVLVLERLGTSLDVLLRSRKRAFSVITSLMIGVQMLYRLESLHEMNIVHRDIKPENIMTGYENNNKTIYICDFGLSRIFRTEHGDHIPDIFGERFSGLHHFAPVRAHLADAQSQRDDLESLGYCIIFFANLRLPWLPRGKPLGDAEMGRLKSETDAEVLCDGLPKAFYRYMREVKKLDFMEKPKYVYLRQILHDDIVRLGGENEKFDWVE